MRLAILAPALLLAACSSDGDTQRSTAQGSGTSRTYDVAGFQRVALEGASQVIVRTGHAPSVRAEGDSEVLDQLEISIEGDRLVVGHRRKNGAGLNLLTGTKAANVFVTVPVLTGASIAGSGGMDIDQVEGEKFDGSIGGSGTLKIHSLRADTAKFSVAGSGDVEAAGRVERLDLNVAGSGDLELAGLEARNLSAAIAGSGNARTKAIETADISILGSGDVTVSGPAKCTVNKAGSGSVRCNG